MTDLIERLRALLAKAAKANEYWESLGRADGDYHGPEHDKAVTELHRAEMALNSEAIQSLPTLLDALEAKERGLTRIANIAARLAEIARSVHIGDLERAEISTLELELVKEKP